MKPPDYLMLGALALSGAWLWLRDRSWLADPANALPVLAALPLFVWLGRPWRFADGPWRWAPRWGLLAATLFALGSLLGSTLLLAGSWTALLGGWLAARVEPEAAGTLPGLMVLPLAAFPWLGADVEHVGWWFRLSGAAVAQWFLSGLHLEVVRHGTLLVVEGLPARVEPACSGLHGLQAMLIAGTVLAYLKLGRTRLYWWNLPVLIAAAWLANALRIIAGLLCGVALRNHGRLAWLEPLHLVAGGIALCAMFLFCWGVFRLEERWLRRRAPGVLEGSVAWRWLEPMVIAYCAWRSRLLLDAWLHSPYDRLDGVCFLVWLLPVLAAGRADAPWPRQPAGWRLGPLSVGVALTFLGDVVDLNLAREAGLAAALMSPPRAPKEFLWRASALAWLPAAGWAASRWGAEPGRLAAVRLLLSLAGGLGSGRLLRPRGRPLPVLDHAVDSHMVS